MRKDVKRQYKKDTKRFIIFAVIMIPIMIVVSFCLSHFAKVDGFLNIFTLVVVGGLGVVMLEIIYTAMQKRKDKKPKKHDPFAD